MIEQRRLGQNGEKCKSPEKKLNSSGFGTFRESHLFRQAGNFYFQIDKGAQNMFNNKHLIRNSINQVKFPAGDRNVSVDPINLSTLAKDSAANLASSIKERTDIDIAHRQRTVDEWA